MKYLIKDIENGEIVEEMETSKILYTKKVNEYIESCEGDCSLMLYKEWIAGGVYKPLGFIHDIYNRRNK